MTWQPFDPTRLMSLARAQHPDQSWLAPALARCTICRREGADYFHFVDPHGAASSIDDRDFVGSITLVDPAGGIVVLEILSGQRVAGARFRRTA